MKTAINFERIKHYFAEYKNKIKNFILNLTFVRASILLAIIFGTFHLFCYLLPFTDDAFVVTNVTPVAADVSGFITNIYVKNGEKVKKGQPIFKVYRPPYLWAYRHSSAQYKEAKQRIIVLEKQILQTKAMYQSVYAKLNKVKYELSLKDKKYVADAVSKLEVVKLKYDVQSLQNEAKALCTQIHVLKETIKEQKHKVKSLRAQKALDKINLDLTIVRAPKDGIIDNMYISRYTPIRIHEPVFSFIDTSQYYIQANFNETDLRNVRPGNKVYVILRMYYFNKLFHGEVVNTIWASERQKTVARSQIQHVRKENEWLMLPQRFPIQIKILDPDPNFPLHPGASAYVYISAQK